MERCSFVKEILGETQDAGRRNDFGLGQDIAANIRAKNYKYLYTCQASLLLVFIKLALCVKSCQPESYVTAAV